MPCYTYNDGPDNSDRKPEPPVRYNPPSAPQGEPPQFGHPQNPQGLSDEGFKKTRNLVAASQIIALVSLVFGGVILSTVAIVLGFIARKRANDRLVRSTSEHSQAWYLLRRSAAIATIMSFVALFLNIMSLMYIYPIVMDMMQGGSMDSVFGGSTGGSTGTSQGSSVWG